MKIDTIHRSSFRKLGQVNSGTRPHQRCRRLILESLETRQLLSAAPVTFSFNPAEFFDYDAPVGVLGDPPERDGGMFSVQETGGFEGSPAHMSWTGVGHTVLDDLQANLDTGEGIGEVQAYILKSPDTGAAVYDWGQELTADPDTAPSGIAPAGWTAQGATDAGNAWIYQWEADSADYFIRPGDDLGTFSLSFSPNEAITYQDSYTIWFGGENWPDFVPAIGFDNWDPGGNGFASSLGTGSAPGTPGTAYQATLSIEATEATPLGPVDFRALDVSTGSLFLLTTTHDAFLTVEASFAPAAGSVELTLYDQNRLALATSVDVDGKQRIDWPAPVVGQEFYFSVDGTNPEVGIAVVNLVNHTGTTVDVYGTDEVDAYSFAPAPGATYEVAVNGVKYGFAETAVDTITFAGGVARDSATITGLVGSDTLDWTDYQLLLTGSGVSVATSNVEDVTVTSGGGDDTAQIHDSAGDDLFTATPDLATLEATDYKLTVDGYRYVHAYSSKTGTDEARFVDSPGRDKTKAEWVSGRSITKMKWFDFDNPAPTTDPYYNRAKGFEKTVANFSQGGAEDVAILWDSPASDIFEGMPNDARFYNNNVAVPFDVTVLGADFMTVYGNDNNAPGSEDQLLLHDSPNDDQFRAKSHKVELFDRGTGGTVHKLVARRFKDVTAYADNNVVDADGFPGGRDIAKLYDSTLDDLWEAEYRLGDTWSNMASSSRDLYEVIAFEQVKGYSFYGGTNSLNKTILAGEVDFVLTYGDWVEV